MHCCRIAAGGFALLAASVVNASAQSCLLPWACQELRSSAKATGANSTQNVKINLPSPRPDPRRLSVAESQQQEPLSKELRQGQAQENQRSTPIDQPARDALFDEFLRWQVHHVIVE
jgi:hypothetical protein